MREVVVDCSIIMAYLLPDEQSSRAEHVMQRLEEGDGRAVVPALFYLEASNALLAAYRRKRADRDRFRQAKQVIFDLQIEVDVLAVGAAWLEILQIAEQWNLTTYDASYLELAVRRRAPLATLDKSLQRAAQSLGVGYE